MPGQPRESQAANAVQSGIQQAADAVSGAADAASQAIEDLTGVNGTAPGNGTHGAFTSGALQLFEDFR